MKRGFTLPELLVVLAILTIFVSIVLASTRDLGLNARVKGAAGVILDAAKETRSNSVAVREFAEDSFPSYGIHMEIAEPEQITVFADCMADDSEDSVINNLDDFAFDPDSEQCSGENGLVEEVPLTGNTSIKSITATYPDSGSSMTSEDLSSVDIQFLRPEPTIWITLDSDELLPVGKIEVVVGDNADRYERTVIFYSTGEFYVE